jgi:hypothetical protein
LGAGLDRQCSGLDVYHGACTHGDGHRVFAVANLYPAENRHAEAAEPVIEDVMERPASIAVVLESTEPAQDDALESL